MVIVNFANCEFFMFSHTEVVKLFVLRSQGSTSWQEC